MIPPEQGADFVWRMEEMLDVYKRPYNPAIPAVCIDEASEKMVQEAVTPILAQADQAKLTDE